MDKTEKNKDTTKDKKTDPQLENPKKEETKKNQNPAQENNNENTTDLQEQDSQKNENETIIETEKEIEASSGPVNLSNLETNTNSANLNKIFIVRGDDIYMSEKVNTFLKSINITGVYTYQNQENSKPIAQIYNENKSITFAVILLNADDFSYSRKNGSPNDAVMKSNQKVIFELGYWIAKLGRDKVAALYYDQKSYRCPTEFFNALYIPFDKKNLWQNELKRKLKDSGFTV